MLFRNVKENTRRNWLRVENDARKIGGKEIIFLN